MEPQLQPVGTAARVQNLEDSSNTPQRDKMFAVIAIDLIANENDESTTYTSVRFAEVGQ